VISRALAERLTKLYFSVVQEENRVEHPTWNEVIERVLESLLNSRGFS